MGQPTGWAVAYPHVFEMYTVHMKYLTGRDVRAVWCVGHTGRRFQSVSTLQDIEIGAICPDLAV